MWPVINIYYVSFILFVRYKFIFFNNPKKQDFLQAVVSIIAQLHPSDYENAWRKS